jgi:hypothetical protein
MTALYPRYTEPFVDEVQNFRSGDLIGYNRREPIGRVISSRAGEHEYWMLVVLDFDTNTEAVTYGHPNSCAYRHREYDTSYIIEEVPW